MRAILIFLSVALVSCGSQNDTVVVDYVAETKPVNSLGDAADDPAIWVNELNPQQSLIFGTDKRKGIHVYSLDGSELGFSELEQQIMSMCVCLMKPCTSQLLIELLAQ